MGDSIVSDSRFLRLQSLIELTKAVISLGSKQSRHASLFYLELFIQIILKNKDRAGSLWPYVRAYFANLIRETISHKNSTPTPDSPDDNLLIERACTGLIQ